MSESSIMQISPFMAMMIGLLFVFSTSYGLMFYYYQGASKQVNFNNIGANPNDPASVSGGGGFLGSFITGSIDALLSFISWISPFAIVRGMILAISPTDLFTVLDIFLLRPISWVVSIITANWIIAKIRGTSEGT